MKSTPNYENYINEKEIFENILENEEFYIIKEHNAYKFIISKKQSEIIIKCKNYDIKFNNNDLSILTKSILNTIDDAYDYIINIFQENKVVIKEIINKKTIKLLMKIYILNKQKEIEIILLYNSWNKDLIINELNNKYSNLKEEIDNLKFEIYSLKNEISKINLLNNNSNINENDYLQGNNNLIKIEKNKYDKDKEININQTKNQEDNNDPDKDILIEKYNYNSIINLNGPVTTLILLKNKIDIAICTSTGFVEIYEIKSFNKKLSIGLINNNPSPKNTILDIVELKYNIISLGCWDGSIRVVELNKNKNNFKILQIVKAHQDNINCLKQLLFYKDEIVIASSSNDGRIILWKLSNKNNNLKKYKEIKLFLKEPDNKCNYVVESLEESFKYNQLISGISNINHIYFCNLKKIPEAEPLKVSVNRCIRSLKIIDNEEILIVAGNQEINIVSVKNRINIYSIRFGFNCEFNCVFQKSNGNILITEYGEKSRIKEFQFIESTLSLNLLSIKEKDFTKYITTIIELDNGDLIIGGYDQKVILYRKSKLLNK